MNPTDNLNEMIRRQPAKKKAAPKKKEAKK